MDRETLASAELDDLEWAEARLRQRLGAGAAVVDLQPISSRLGSLRRVLVSHGAGTQTCYLKRYEPESRASVADHFADLDAANAAFTNAAGLLPYDIIGSDAGRGVILMAEVPGQPLGALHRSALFQPGARASAVTAWRGVGRWLARLHWTARPPAMSATLPAELVDYIQIRFRDWGREDATCAALSAQASAAAERACRLLRGAQVTTTLCHGDVSTGNIILQGAAVGMIDMDDLRMDMPALDLSQALLEIDEFARVASALPFPRFRARATAAFREGYGRPFPEGPEYWLPHLRNLSVFVLTLARRRKDGGVSTGLRYRRTIAEIRRVIARVPL